jgi:DNA-binding response OmpR family regulator
MHAAPCPPYFMMTTRVDNTAQLARMEQGIRGAIERLIGPTASECIPEEEVNPESLFSKEENLVAGPISINSKHRSVSVSDSEIHLTPIEFKILRFLVSNPEKVVTRRELTTVLYGRGIEDRYRVVDCHIARIRKKILRHLPGRSVIRSVYGTGYAFRIPEEV